MFSHVMVGTNDPDKARAFYDATLAEIGIAGRHTPKGAFYGTPEGGMFGVTMPRDEKPATYANGGTVGFKAERPEQIDAWYAKGLELGGSDEGPPGPREYGAVPIYAAYMRDPEGNKLCAICVTGEPGEGS
jgi:catechol 2,3-dioxygenase-like lactoylglutathione lyase family enzyme